METSPIKYKKRIEKLEGFQQIYYLSIFLRLSYMSQKTFVGFALIFMSFPHFSKSTMFQKLRSSLWPLETHSRWECSPQINTAV